MTMRPCWAEISIRALEDNYRFLNSLVGGDAELLAVVKANAYGHSLQICAPAAVRAGARWLGVTSVDEGVAARAVCPEAQIMVMCGCFPGEGAAVIDHRLTAVVWEPWQLDELEAAARAADVASLPVHVEIDTGMSRQGVALEAVAAFAAGLGTGGLLRLEGVCTHLYAADESDGLSTDGQFTLLEEALGRIAATGLTPEWLSVGSSPSLLNGESARIGAVAARWEMKALIRPGL